MFELFRKKTKFEKVFKKSYLGKYNKIVEKGYENDNSCLLLVKSKSNNNQFVVKIKNMIYSYEFSVHNILYNNYHSNVQKVFYFQKEKYTTMKKEEYFYFIAYEYIEGCNLSEYFKSKEYIRESEIKYIIRQIVAGVKFLHQNNIIHGDLKMENIIINPFSNKVKIIDFDLSVISEKAKKYKSDNAFGTLEYIAPESAYSFIYSDKSDVWQIGVLLYTLVVSKFPYNDLKDMSNINFDVLNNNLPLRDLLEKMLKYSVKERCDIKDIEESKWLNS